MHLDVLIVRWVHTADYWVESPTIVLPKELHALIMLVVRRAKQLLDAVGVELLQVIVLAILEDRFYANN